MKIKFICFTLLLFIQITLTSCGLVPSIFYSDYGVSNLGAEYESRKNESILTTLKDAKLVTDDCVNSTLFKNDDSTWKNKCSAQRTTIIGDLISISNAVCEEHKRAIWGNEASFNIVTGTLTNIFSGAATVVTGGAGQALLAGLALFSNAERSLGNETVYKNMVAPAIVQKIEDARSGKLQVLKQNLYLQPKPYSDYPLSVAILDLSEYHNSCSFMFGLERAIQEGTKDPKPGRIIELTNLLSQLSLQLDGRERTLRSINKAVSNDEINNDLQYAGFKSRYNAVSAQLKALETTAPTQSNSPPPVAPTTTPKQNINEE